MTNRRWLPANVTEWTDRHGKKRYRWRKTGCSTYHFKAAPGTVEFAAELASAVAAARPGAFARLAVPRSIDDLAARYYRTPRWKGMAASSQTTYRGIIDRFRDAKNRKGIRYGGLPADRVTVSHLDTILGRMADRPAAANNLRKSLKRLFAYAVKLGWRIDNPAALTDGFKAGKGWHTWTDDEIAQFRLRHPLGSKARLALELALNTAARRCNIATLDRTQLRAGKFHIQHVKGCDATIVRASAEALAAIDAMGVTGIGHFLVTEFGKPFSVAGLGNKFRDWCDQAGLEHCSIHGLRKAQSRRLAESGATMLQGRAVTGHKTDSTFAYYAEQADREALADAAMDQVGKPRFGKPGEK